MVNPAGGSGRTQGRDGACTPKWLADLLGWFDLDPASNERSHILSRAACVHPQGDGLVEKLGPGWFRQAEPYYGFSSASDYHELFCNPPFARGQVIRWIGHYRHTRFCFLLRWDPSTNWFAELLPHCTHVWFGYERIQFEPPPGVVFSSNPFPHALYLRDPPADRLARLRTRGYVMPVDSRLLRAQCGSHDEYEPSHGAGDEDRGSGDAAEGNPG